MVRVSATVQRCFRRQGPQEEGPTQKIIWGREGVLDFGGGSLN